MTEPFTSARPDDDRGLFTATTEYRAAGTDRVQEMSSVLLSRSSAFEKLREQFHAAVGDNASRVRLTIVQDKASGSEHVFRAVGAPRDVETRLDHATGARPANEHVRPAPWQVAAGPLTAPANAPRPQAQPPSHAIGQPPSARSNAVHTERGLQR